MLHQQRRRTKQQQSQDCAANNTTAVFSIYLPPPFSSGNAGYRYWTRMWNPDIFNCQPALSKHTLVQKFVAVLSPLNPVRGRCKDETNTKGL
jgi:hypothetical protein